MKLVLVFFFLTLLQQLSGHGEAMLPGTNRTKIVINKTYEGSLDSNNVLSYTFHKEPYQAIRIHTALVNTQNDLQLPLLISVEQKRSILSWTLPLNLSKFADVSYNQVSRTLCSDHREETANITIWVLTSSPQVINFSLMVTIVPGFKLAPNTDTSFTQINIIDGSPQFFFISFPSNSSSDVMRISLSSHQSSCVIASLQPAECPVDDLLSTVAYRGVYLTFNKVADIIIDKSTNNREDHFLVLVSAPDSRCESLTSLTNDTAHSPPLKTVDIRVVLQLANWEYWRPVLILLVLILLPFFVLIPLFIFETVVIRKYKFLQRHYPLIFYTPPLANIIEDDEERDRNGNQNSDPTTLLVNNDWSRRDQGPNLDLSASINQSENNNDSIRITDSFTQSSVPRHASIIIPGVVGMSKKKMSERCNRDDFHLNDLSRKDDDYLWKKYLLYLTSVVTVTMFYALPALQVVIFRVVLYSEGDNDLCYFNFKCAHKLGGAISFNNIWSNVAYLVLGLVFLLVTMIKHWLRTYSLRHDTNHEYRDRGVTPYFGIYYAIGFALISEGLMSSIYHTCPSGINFQFDSTFMFVISTLCILKLYQNRHPDVSVSASTAFLLLGSLIILTAFGLLTKNEEFYLVRTTYALIVITVTVFICIHVYFFSYPSLLCSAIWSTLTSKSLSALGSAIKNCFWPPANRPRIAHIVILIIANGISLGCLFFHVFDPASALLVFMVFNLIIYILYYWGMKLIYKEVLHRPAVALFAFFLAIIATVFFFSALVFFLQSVTNWQISPSNSRLLNEECIFLGFYDNHDIWHILSAFGLFFNFLSITMIDDNISDLPKNVIRVF